MKAALRIAIIGAECSGKTTLAQALEMHFSGLWVPEQLRAFCQLHGRTPRRDEQRLVMQAQLQAEDMAMAQAELERRAHVFCDTSALLTAIYSDHYFSDPSLLESARSWQTRYALTLLLVPDLPWVADGIQRDGAAVQAAIHARLLHELHHQRCPYLAVSGQGTCRVQTAVAAVAALTG